MVFSFVSVGSLAALMSTADSQLLSLSTMLTANTQLDILFCSSTKFTCSFQQPADSLLVKHLERILLIYSHFHIITEELTCIIS